MPHDPAGLGKAPAAPETPGAADAPTRARTEDALRESERRFRELFDNAPIAMVIAPVSASHILEANPAFARFLGYRPDEVVGLTLQQICAPEGAAAPPAAEAQLAQQQCDGIAVEKHYRRKDGRPVWGRATATIVHGHDGAPRYLMMQIEDIEARKAAEVELEDAKRRLALALEASELSLWDYDIESGTVVMDEQWAILMGGPPGVTYTTDSELRLRTHPDDRGNALAAAVAAFKGERAGFLSESRLRTADDRWKWIRCSGKVVERAADGRALRAIGTNQDVSARKAAEETIREMAFHDNLTGLPNRVLFHDRLQQAVAVARRSTDPLSVLFLDLDNFKPINDTYGHEAGDQVLEAVARRLQGTVRDSDTLARLGGDEFGIVAPQATREEAQAIAGRVRGALDAAVEAGGQAFALGVSVGLATYPEDGATPDELLRRADQEMYEIKQRQRRAGA